MTAWGSAATSRTNRPGWLLANVSRASSSVLRGNALSAVGDGRAPLLVERERALARLPELVGDPVGVADHEVGRVDEHAAIGLGDDVEAPHHRRREGVLDGPPLGRVVGPGPEPQVGLDEQHAPPDPLEPDDPLAAELAPVEPDVVRPEPGGQRDGVQQVGVERRHFQPDRPRVAVPPDREEPVVPVQPGRLGLDGRQRGRRPRRPRRRDRGGRGGGAAGDEGDQRGGNGEAEPRGRGRGHGRRVGGRSQSRRAAARRPQILRPLASRSRPAGIEIGPSLRDCGRVQVSNIGDITC